MCAAPKKKDRKGEMGFVGKVDLYKWLLISQLCEG